MNNKDVRDIIDKGLRVQYTIKTDGWADVEEYLDELIKSNLNIVCNGESAEDREEARIKHNVVKKIKETIVGWIEDGIATAQDEDKKM